jgi:thioredoxin-related protein
MMKIKTRLLIGTWAAVLAIALGGGDLSSKGKLNWHSYNEGMRKAKQQQKPVIVDFYASWCHWCVVMDRETFADEKIVRKLSSDYIAVRLDVESGETIRMGGNTYSPREFASMMGVNGLPTVAFFEKTGKLITMVPGYIKAGTMLPLLGYISEECYKSTVSFKDYMEKKKGCAK